MAKFVAVTASPTGIAHPLMAAEALRRAAQAAGHELRAETQSALGAQDPLSPAEIAAADAVIVAADDPLDEARFAGKTVVRASTQSAIGNAAGLIAQAAQASGGGAQQGEPVPQAAPIAGVMAAAPNSSAASVIPNPGNTPSGPAPLIVGVTSCPTGIAHTFMAAEGLEGGARSLGYEVKVETQGSVGAGNPLSAEDIRRAEIVVIAADTNVDLSRFAGKRVYQTGTKPAIRDGAGVVRTALAEAPVYSAAAAAPGGDYVADAASAKAAKNAGVPDFYKHLMTGVSFMLPFVVAGGLLIALGFAFGGIYVYEDKYAGSFGNTLFNIGANGAFKLFVPVLAGYIAYSIADRPGLAPGMVGGILAATGGSGFLGAMVAGFLAGYITKALNQGIRLPRTLEGLKPTLLLPLLGTLSVGLLMVYVVGAPVAAALKAATGYLSSLQGSSAGLLGALLGAMMAFDMGGPINKAAYTFSTGLLTEKNYGPIAASMAAGMTPPLALFFATLLFKSRFTPDEREAGKAAGVLGLAFITEGAIPFAARDPLRVIPALMAGSATAGAISMAAGVQLRAPHGGVFVLPIPQVVTHLPVYILAIVAGTAVSTLLLGLLKRPIAALPEGSANLKSDAVAAD